MQEYRIASGTASLLCREAGAGEPLILLHGNGEDGLYFRAQFEPFSHFYRVIAVDSRGHGGSTLGEEGLSIGRMAEDLLDVMDALGIERAHLLGFSDGGNIALTFALAWPRRVDRLVLNGANLNPAGVKRTVQLPIELGYRIVSRFAGKNEKAKRKAELLGLMVNEPNVAPEELAGIQARTLVIAGTKDLIKADHTRLIAEKIPDSQLVWIEGGHFVAGKNPEPFNEAVLNFLAQ